MYIDIDKIYVVNVICYFLANLYQIFGPWLMSEFHSATNGQDFIKFCICIDTEKV